MQRNLTVSERKSSGLWETVKTLVYAVGIALVVRTFAYEPFNIPSGSMKPTLLVGDYLFVSKFSYGYSRYSFPFGLPPFDGRVFGSLPERGDVVVFKLPSDNKTDYIKRVVGLPGDRIQVLQGVLHINGEPVRLEPAGVFREDIEGRTFNAQRFIETLPNGVSHYILDLTATGPLDNTRVYEVPPGHVFAMGDNRDNSLDSRVDQVGFIPVENLIGRAEILFFSIDTGASFLQPWNWPFEIRYGRLLNLID
jgi:signal peptidase I